VLARANAAQGDVRETASAPAGVAPTVTFVPSQPEKALSSIGSGVTTVEAHRRSRREAGALILNPEVDRIVLHARE
jgi:hypothetical protein